MSESNHHSEALVDATDPVQSSGGASEYLMPPRRGPHHRQP
jgi:hypothetical protein